MAPVKNNALGFAPQMLDDPELIKLIKELSSVEITNVRECRMEAPPVDIERLVALVEPHPTWTFEEQVNLLEWIAPLNAIDAALTYMIKEHPGLILIEPSDPSQKHAGRKQAKDKEEEKETHTFARSMDEVNNVPDRVKRDVSILLRFLCALLRNATNKLVFNSVDEVGDLLAAADGSIAALALEVLAAVATPPSLHRQMAPEVHQHSSALHSPRVACHRRLVALARGWGSRGAGLGLFYCATADDSEFGQGGLPTEAGEVFFQYFAPQRNLGSEGGEISKPKDDSCLATIHLSASDVVAGPLYPNSEINIVSEQKRRRISSRRAQGMRTNSTAELFFKCIEKAGGRDKIPEDRLFPLLANIRLARCFYSTRSRIAAIEYRLMALIAILYAHPSQDILSGYFQAQPELCVELIDLLLPSVSAKTVSTASAKATGTRFGDLKLIESLANPATVPYNIRNLAIEALTALVARRDGASGGLTGVARQSNILNELGVGRGLYLGLLPTLVRFTLASLNSFLSAQEVSNDTFKLESEEEDIAMDIGIAFLEASTPPSLPPKYQLERAFIFIDNVLTLASAVVSAPSGTASLTDCGIIAALLSTVALESKTKGHSFSSIGLVGREIKMVRAHLRYISSQAIQIIEGCIANHANALTIFYDLKGVEMLISRLHGELVETKRNNSEPMEVDSAEELKDSNLRTLCSSRRVLIFSMVNCLSVVFHQESTSSSSSNQSSGGLLLRKPELSFVLKEILENAALYGGILASLACALISDVMNSDPHVVKHVHSSGLAKACFKMMAGDERTYPDGRQEWIPLLPPVHELVMTLPNVLSALALTSDGAEAVNEANPFQSLLKIFYHPMYAMPKSRCLLSETSAIIGTGLDEIMRHVPSLRPQVMASIVDGINQIIEIGRDLHRCEETEKLDLNYSEATPLEDRRSCLMQYVLNFGQIMEQILQTEEHCTPFVQIGGLDAILGLFPLLMPSSTQFLANASCLSCPSIGSLAHTTTEDSLSVAFKCIMSQFDAFALLKKMIAVLKGSLKSIESSQVFVRAAFSEPARNGEACLSALGITDNLSRRPFFAMREEEGFVEKSIVLAKYLRNVATLQWQTQLLGDAILAASQRSQDGGTGWGRNEREWKKLLSSDEFEELMNRLSQFYQSALLESCRFRSDPEFESAYKNRVSKDGRKKKLCYRLRIVCQEGAVVRDGIEIDSCANIGSMEMGEIVVATDRCLNSSGVMRYRTQRGWVSELTRGHGRESIAEVIDVRELTSDVDTTVPRYPDNSKKRIEYGVSSVADVVAAILARLQTSHCDLFSALNRIVTQGILAVPVRTLSFQSRTWGGHVRSLLQIVASNIARGFDHEAIAPFIDSTNTIANSTVITRGATALYLSSLISHLHACLFEEKRDKRTVNLLLLLFAMNSDPGVAGLNSFERESGQIRLNLFGAVKFVFEYALDNLLRHPSTVDDSTTQTQVIGRSVAASIPPTIVFLRRLVSTSVISTSPLINALERWKERDIYTLVGGNIGPIPDLQSADGQNSSSFFVVNRFTGALIFNVATVVQDVWKDPRFVILPAHILHPLTLLASEIMSGLEEMLNAHTPASISASENPTAAEGLQVHRDRVARSNQPSGGEADTDMNGAEFEASDEAIRTLTEMGFSREHALDAIEISRSNRLEVAMEYALSHPPPSPTSAERRRSERDSRRRQLEQQEEEINGDGERGTIVVEPSGTIEPNDVAGPSMDTENMDVDISEKANKDLQSSHSDEANEKLRSCLSSWITLSPTIAFNILSGANSDLLVDSRPVKSHFFGNDNGDGQGNGDTEALTVVISSFILGLCHKHPNKRDDIILDLVSRLKSQLTEETVDSSPCVKVQPGKECSFAALCHATVLFTRALPKTRIRILQKGLVHCLVSCIPPAHVRKTWPIWLAPSMLLLEVMAQPIASFYDEKDCDVKTENDGFTIGCNELEQVREEHRKQGETLSTIAKAVFSPSKFTEGESKSSGEDLSNAMVVTSEMETCIESELTSVSKGDELDASEPFSIPPYSPLIPTDLITETMVICLDILGNEGKCDAAVNIPPPGIVHATLLLLTRLVRSPLVASHCLKLGAVDLVLSLPRSSRFIGNVGITTTFFRRLIEDEATLQTSMETEIRSSLAKKTDKFSSLPLFIQSVTPLICRDAISFIKAVAVTVSIDTSSKSDSNKGIVSLLNAEQRSQKAKSLAESLQRLRATETKLKQDTTNLVRSSEKKGVANRRRSSSGKSTWGKVPHQRSSVRAGLVLKRSRKFKCNINASPRRVPDTVGTPSNQVISMLVGKVLDLCSSAGDAVDSFLGENTSFLWAADLVEVLADLVLAIPACAAAIHRFRTVDLRSTSTEYLNLHHGLSGCPSPPRTFVNFLLHQLLPQDRWSFGNDHDIWDRRNRFDDEVLQTKNKNFYIKTKAAQATARLLVALVARAGEGRRRVITDLSFALSGGSLGPLENDVIEDNTVMALSTWSADSENRALQAWGDICIGLAAPRSNGVNLDNIASLSYEVIKLMLDCGMCHALLCALQRVQLQHPMAAQVCASLLIPLEVFTRSLVTDQVLAIADKEVPNKERNEKEDEQDGENKKEKKRKANRVSFGPSQRSETAFADDAMLEAGFDADAGRNGASDFDNEYYESSIDLEANEEDNDMIIDEDLMEEAENADETSDDDLQEGSDIDDESDVDSSEDSEEDEESSSDPSDDVESIGEDDDSDDDGDDEEEDDGWGMVEEDEVAPGEDFFDDEIHEETGLRLHSHLNQLDGDADEGWTRVDASSALGGMRLAARRHAMRAGLQNRGRGFMMDTAEAMIGALLRTGSIESDALAEIEGSLGIRIMNRGSDMFREDRGMWTPTEAGRSYGGGASPAERRGGEVLGTVPHVNQRSPPDIGYSALGGSRSRWSELSSLEYVYGGPSVATGNRNYDTVSGAARDESIEVYPTPSAVNSQLFPGGPAASTHSRPQQALHPLLCGIELPPVNAMISDLLPHGYRSSHRSQINSRRPGEWGSWSMSSQGNLISTLNGNLLRLNRGFLDPTDLPPSRPLNSRLVGWTDDGLPLDATLGDFCTAFERALGVTTSVHESDIEQEHEGIPDGDNGGDRPVISATTDPTSIENNTLDSMERERNALLLHGQGLHATQAVTLATANGNSIGVHGNTASDSGMFASSLAAGLRLSPPRDESPSSELVSVSGPADPEQSGQNPSTSNQSNEEGIDTIYLPENEERQEAGPEAEAVTDVEGTILSVNHATVAGMDSQEHDSNFYHLARNLPNAYGLVCPPGMDLEVFDCLPVDMQREVISHHQTTVDVAAQLDSTSGLDPEILAALPEEMRREIIAHEQHERQMQAPADPSNAEDMDNANFLASLNSDLREDILLTADEAFLNSLPPNILAEAQVLRERASIRRQAGQVGTAFDHVPPQRDGISEVHSSAPRRAPEALLNTAASSNASRKKNRPGNIKVDLNREHIIYTPKMEPKSLVMPFGAVQLRSLLQLMFLLSPVRPQRLLQKLFHNLCANSVLRGVLAKSFTKLLNDDGPGVLFVLSTLDGSLLTEIDRVDFPPHSLIGAAPEVLESSMDPDMTMSYRRQLGSAATSIAANLPASARGSSNGHHIPLVVSTRVIDTLSYLGKNSARFCLNTLTNDIMEYQDASSLNKVDTCFEEMLDLLSLLRYTTSSTNLEQLLAMLEIFVAPLSSLPRTGEQDYKLSDRDFDSAAGSGKEWVTVPRIIVSPLRLKLLCSILKMESCRDSGFSKVNAIAKRLCNIEANRGCILSELASVAQALGEDAIRDLCTLSIRMSEAASMKREQRGDTSGGGEELDAQSVELKYIADNSSSSVTLSTSSSELKLLRVLQTLQSLYGENSQDEQNGSKADTSIYVTNELIAILKNIHLEKLWEQLSSCLNAVKVLEGISSEEIDEKNPESDQNVDDANDGQIDDGSNTNIGNTGKKLQNSVAGLLTRFLPSIEAFFVVNASATRTDPANDENKTMDTTEGGSIVNETETSADLQNSETGISSLVGGKQVIDFVSENRILLNALIRNNAGLLDKGLRSMVQVSRLRGFLDFDVKRQWFKSQIRRLRQHASRRHGSLRLVIRRKNVFEEAYQQLRLRNEDEMRSRLHITFRNEEGVDAGGLSREFFGILAKEMFNPNYALFTSTEDGCTFQPNQHSSINPDHLSYFRFVGRIVGKALADGFLLDAHFTRSLYKHMLGIKPTHHDMEAIDPDYYKNLQTLLEYKLTDLGLELNFSIEDHSFGRNQIVDLIPNGRNIHVTDESKTKYVSLVCQHRMTHSIQSQIRAYLDGFYELVSPDLIAIFTPRELELMISGLPNIDILDLKQNTDYQGWKATDKEIEWFWNIMVSLSRSQKAAFLQFVTGSSKVPLTGFSELQGMRGIQKFNIHKVEGSSGALMSAHTCFNSLDLPTYKSEEEMKGKLLYAISEGQGAFMFA